MGSGTPHVNFRASIVALGPLISAQLEGALVEVEVPGTEPALTLRADPRDPGQARFLALAIDMSRSAQAKIDNQHVDSRKCCGAILESNES